MRGIGGRGNIVDQKNDGKKIGKKGLPGINTNMAFQDYERIMGKEKVDEERQVAARKMSSKKGRWERKLAAIKSSLENFVPDVRPGNQTALKTRAHPYALYIARMHRRIHELWGFGFLEDLDNKGADYPLNDPNLWVNLEIYILTEVPDDGGVGVLDDGQMVANVAKLPGKKKKLAEVSRGQTVTPDDGREHQKVSPDSSVTDKQALFAANLWVSAFATAQVDKLVKYSTVPFYAGGKVAAQTQAELKDMFSGLVVESGPMKDWKLLTPNE